jgi:hypothetical protein
VVAPFIRRQRHHRVVYLGIDHRRLSTGFSAPLSPQVKGVVVVVHR